MTTNTPSTWPPCYVFASQEFNLVFIVFPFLVSFETMTRDHLHKASRLAPRRVQTLVVIKLYFIDLRQGEELEMVKFSPFIWGVLKSACRIVLPYRSFLRDFTAAIYKTKWRPCWYTKTISLGLDSCHVKIFFCSKQFPSLLVTGVKTIYYKSEALLCKKTF